eukprot:GHUV01019085.1.p1 GENE.GHUV01019085.1~~GHUV01019085.1.p1  ORF type:complete len:206 (+),score=79.22 GHUV01019085.1:1150-1767(+)
MADWEGVSDVAALKAMLAAQQAQLQQLQADQAPCNTGKQIKPARKRKAAAARVEGYEVDDSEDNVPAAEADSEDYNPADDSDYDAPKKSSSKKKATSSSKSKKSRTSAADRDTDSDDDGDAPALNSAQVTKAAAAALRSIKSTINAQMVYKPSLKYGTSRVSLELPCLSMAVVQHMLGANLMAKATNGKKQLQVLHSAIVLKRQC